MSKYDVYRNLYYTTDRGKLFAYEGNVLGEVKDWKLSYTIDDTGAISIPGSSRVDVAGHYSWIIRKWGD